MQLTPELSSGCPEMGEGRELQHTWQQTLVADQPQEDNQDMT